MPIEDLSSSAIYQHFIAEVGSPEAHIKFSELDSWIVRIWHWQILESIGISSVTSKDIALFIKEVDQRHDAHQLTSTQPEKSITAQELFDHFAIPTAKYDQLQQMYHRLQELIGRNPAMKITEEVDPSNEAVYRLLVSLFRSS